MSAIQPLRPRQETALYELRRAVSQGTKRMILQAPTGFGKTRLTAALVEGALAKRNRVMFTVPALSLIDQTIDMFWAQGIRDVGVIQANHDMTNGLRPVQIASIQTLQKRDVEPPDVMVIDEAHRWFKHYEKIMASKDWADTIFVGLSATPWTKGLGNHFKKLIIAGTVLDGITEGWLSKFRTFAPVRPDLSKVRTVGDDYNQKDLAEAMDLPPLTADIIQTWLTYGQGRPTFCFAVDRAHAHHLQEKFQQHGISTGYVDAFTLPEERRAIREKFERDDIEVVVNVGCLTTGVDWDVRCIILARPTKSEMLYVQMIGRGLRTTPEGKPEKDHLLILDHTGTTENLGRVTDIHYEELDTSERRAALKQQRENRPKPSVCGKCSFMKPPGVRECPACGFAPTKQTRLHEAPGELRELKAEAPTDRGPRAPEDVKRRWYAMLLHYATERGYKPGWVRFKYLARFQKEPSPWMAAMAPQAPDPEVVSWIKSQNIRHAKGRAKAA